MKTTRIPLGRCPKCDSRLDGASARSDKTPEIGDVTICLYCAAVLRFGGVADLLVLNEVTADEYARFDADYRTAIEDARAVVRAASVPTPASRGIR